MSTPQRILVTGSAGRIGRAVVAELLARGHTVVGFDRVADGAASMKVVGTLEDAGLLQFAAADVSAIIHLAAAPDDAQYPRGEAPDDGDNFLTDLVPSNIIGPYSVLETARKLKIPRVILASTGQVIDGHLKAGNIPVTPDSPPRPRFLYACTKVFLEALGQVYAKEYGIEVLAVRLGWCPRAGQEDEFARTAIGPDVYLSPGDAGRFFAATVEAATLPPFAVVYATSRHVRTLQYDLTASQRWLGWEPRDKWPEGMASGAA